MKLDKNNDHGSYYWVAHPSGVSGGYYSNKASDQSLEKMLCERRYELDIIGGIEDKEADYSYDDWALAKLDKDYYLFSTSGCSCPSPTETWRVEMGPCSLNEIEKNLKNGNYDGYTVPGRQMQEFLDLIAEAKKSNV